MDCEKFDQIIIDAVYDELDELTLAAAKRHADGCPHCQTAWSGLRATRKIGILPLVEAPAGLDARIMQAARDAHRNLPWPKRVGRAISWAGSYAMRPQAAMAALFVLMLGSSIIFVRAKPDRSGARSTVSVTERGVPEQAADDPLAKRSRSLERAPMARLGKRDEGAANLPPPMAASPREAPLAESEVRAARGADKGEGPGDIAPSRKSAVQAAPAPAAPSLDDVGSGAGESLGSAEKKRADPAAGGLAPATPVPNEPKDAYATAMDRYNAGNYVDSEKAFDAVVASGSRNAASAALYAAKSAELAFGCGKAASKYDSAANRFGMTTPGAEAEWGAANCYKSLGNYGEARVRYEQLRSVAGYRDRAEGELANLTILEQRTSAQRAPAAAAKPAAKAHPAAPKATSEVTR